MIPFYMINLEMTRLYSRVFLHIDGRRRLQRI